MHVPLSLQFRFVPISFEDLFIVNLSVVLSTDNFLFSSSEPPWPISKYCLNIKINIVSEERKGYSLWSINFFANSNKNSRALLSQRESTI
jgi:hypothetical protein